jgi:hypothetical protein
MFKNQNYISPKQSSYLDAKFEQVADMVKERHFTKEVEKKILKDLDNHIFHKDVKDLEWMVE